MCCMYINRSEIVIFTTMSYYLACLTTYKICIVITCIRYRANRAGNSPSIYDKTEMSITKVMDYRFELKIEVNFVRFTFAL